MPESIEKGNFDRVMEEIKTEDNSVLGCERGRLCFTKNSQDNYQCQTHGYNKLDVKDWLVDIPRGAQDYDVVEIRFKNTRKGFYYNINNLKLDKGDVVAVEASPGHDIGIVSITGPLVRLQMKKTKGSYEIEELKKVYRKAKPVDIEKWQEAIALEQKTMIKSRILSAELNLAMKIGDVEYQGDKTKAIFYYIADERVDFRELIKVLADSFKIRVEMRQIGARQEAGRIGGIGPCGRELCCSTWMSNFVSVTTNSARYQDISLNPQKLAGQCSKLKCCLNYELDAYLDEQKDFPSTQPLETLTGTYFHQKTDIFKRLYWYSSDKEMAANLTAISVDRVKEIIEENKKGKKPEKIIDPATIEVQLPNIGYANTIEEDSLHRFDEKSNNDKPFKKKKKKPRRNFKNRTNENK